MGVGFLLGWTLVMIAIYFKAKASVEKEQEDEWRARQARLDLEAARRREFLKRSIEIARHNGLKPDSRL